MKLMSPYQGIGKFTPEVYRTTRGFEGAVIQGLAGNGSLAASYTYQISDDAYLTTLCSSFE
jgi:hypothetical protein